MRILKVIVPALLMISINAHANGYCDSKQTPQAVDACYQHSLQILKKAVDKALAKNLNSPNHSQATKNQVLEEQQAWEQRVQATCQNYACVEFYLQGRLLQLNRLPQQKHASTGVDPEACLDEWIAAYRQEEGDEITIIHDQITEWQNWCSEGKLP